MRRALLVGLNEYASAPHLQGCVADVDGLAPLLKRNGDESPNFKCESLTGAGGDLVTTRRLREYMQDLFAHDDGDVLFYFSGHGAATTIGGHLMTYESGTFDPGLPMRELVDRANEFAKRTRRNAIIILDCCYAGAAGTDEEVVGTIENDARLSEGVTIIAAARHRQRAVEIAGHGAFTRLVVAALQGGAADLRGRVSAASIYAHAEAVLGALDQRPIYKSHAASLEPVRLCVPAVPDHVLRQLTKLFRTPDVLHHLDPTYERTHVNANPAKVAIFQALKRLQVGGLARCETGFDMYDTAMESQSVLLTPLGKFYWELADADQF